MPGGVATETQPLQNGYSFSPLYRQRTAFQQPSTSTSTSNPIFFGPCDEVDNKTDHFNGSPFSEMNEFYSNEENRLKSFEYWPLQWLDKKTLAQTGMYYTHQSDKVKCYFCEVEIGRWERDDDPVSEHLRWSPNCPLLRRRTTNNTPMNAAELDQLLPPFSYDVCGANDTAIEVRPNAYAEGTISAPRMMTTTAVNTGLNSSSSCSNQASCSNAYYPEYPEYAIEAARVRSFAEWPRHMKQKPEELAEAGFFYIGVGDRVKCFSCGGGLKDWDEFDEPWEQHALWLNKCRYLKLIKGQSYIDAVIAKEKAKEAGIESEKPQEPQELQEPQSAQEEQTLAAELPSSETTPKPNATATTECSNNPTFMNCDDLPITNNLVHFDGSNQLLNKVTKISSITTTTTANSGTEPTVATAVGNVEKKSTIPEEKLCKICYAAEYNTAFLPCGHVVACAKCASSVTKCPLCRKPFTDVMRVYFS